LSTIIGQLIQFLKLFSIATNKSPFIYLILFRNCYRSASSSSDIVNLNFFWIKKRNYFWNQNAIFRRISIALPMNVEPVSIKIAPTLTFKLSITLIINRLNTITSTSYYQCVEISDCNLKYFLLIKLLKSKYIFIWIHYLINLVDPQASIHVWASCLELVEYCFFCFDCILNFDLN